MSEPRGPVTEAGRGPETVGAGGWLVEALHRAIRDYSEGPCTGTHLMGYGECQQLAARISPEKKSIAAARAEALAEIRAGVEGLAFVRLSDQPGGRWPLATESLVNRARVLALLEPDA